MSSVPLGRHAQSRERQRGRKRERGGLGKEPQGISNKTTLGAEKLGEELFAKWSFKIISKKQLHKSTEMYIPGCFLQHFLKQFLKHSTFSKNNLNVHHGKLVK